MMNDNDWYTAGPGDPDRNERPSNGAGFYGDRSGVDDGYSFGADGGDAARPDDEQDSPRRVGRHVHTDAPGTPMVDRGVLGLLKGRTFLYLLAVLAVFALVTVIASAVRGNAEQHDSDVRASILAALPVSSESEMKRQTDTMLGKVLAQGKVTIPKDSCVNFEETSGCYAKLSRQMERYQSHQESYECGTSGHRKTCYRTVWRWDEIGFPDTIKAKNAVILGETVGYDTVSIPAKHYDAHDLGIMGYVSFGYYYPRGKGDQNTRYSYDAVPGEYSGVAFLDTSKGRGHITKFHDFVEGSTANEQRDKAKKPSRTPAIVFWIFEVLALIGSVTAGFLIVRNDLNDGRDSGF